jgi:3-carboxy-cis,cis-muconate cycloisomerase
MLLAPSLGREAAHELVGRASREAIASGRGFSESLAAFPEVSQRLTPADLATLDNPEAYLGVAERLRLRLLTRP